MPLEKLQIWTEFGLTSMVKNLDPTRPVNSVSGFNDFGAGDFHDNHHYPFPQCGAPFYSLPSTPHDPTRIAVQGEFGGIGHIPGRQNLWNVQSQLDTLNQTFEITSTIEIWNYRATRFIEDLRDQARFFSCSGGIYTQTTDVEGETNGLLTVSGPQQFFVSYHEQEAEILISTQYDCRLLQPNIQRWQRLISEIYAAPHQATAAYAASTVKPVKFSVTLANQ
ncbi:uncharacterized protein PGTG_00780 [Puccinia graminis f. sp. tritici CRL 75-36-700-3]|uniref:Uncharacterized protein n=1 Tax=Puccinia graminis f. sp. tritici (strain CRL 75-36-700-3 / race SCCL) TaxID=418459 RepID=E3JTV2_PUCGT|nr:uncharacterized protein PGTG_00780 [Puccinia graminis f. sp. tritici CRL 75-36-700-3]EFP75449.2 hypothetical protein PGTG_00780 [Puccinia graminis f. sp. tritici CRL 75-36-700-3]